MQLVANQSLDALRDVNLRLAKTGTMRALLLAVFSHGVCAFSSIAASRVSASAAMLATEAPTSVDDAKATLLKQISYNKPLLDSGEEIISYLIESSSESQDKWWEGAFVMNSANLFNKALRAATGPLLDGAPVTVTVSPDDGKVHIETDMIVVGCATGLRIFGSMSGSDATASVTLDKCEFFEPSEEFGITKALDKCEAELRPKLPSAETPMSATLNLRYCDDTLVVVGMVADGAEDEVPLIFSKVPAEEMETMRARRG